MKPDSNPNQIEKNTLSQSPVPSTQSRPVEPLLENALQQARTLQDRRAETYALGYLGKLYLKQGQFVRQPN